MEMRKSFAKMLLQQNALVNVPRCIKERRLPTPGPHIFGANVAQIERGELYNICSQKMLLLKSWQKLSTPAGNFHVIFSSFITNFQWFKISVRVSANPGLLLLVNTSLFS